MKVITIGIQKGGQGKTCIACHLAWFLSQKKSTSKQRQRVLVLDLDSQANATYTLSDHAATGLSASSILKDPMNAGKKMLHYLSENPSATNRITLVAADNDLADLDKKPYNTLAINLKRFFQIVKGEFDYCIIDLAPTLGSTLVSSLIATNYLISPFEPETYSLHGVKRLLTIVQNLRKENPDIFFIGLLPNKVDFRKPRVEDNFLAVKEAYGDLVLDTVISNRDSFAEAVTAAKQPVWSIRKTSARPAAKEIKAFGEHVFQVTQKDTRGY